MSDLKGNSKVLRVRLPCKLYFRKKKKSKSKNKDRDERTLKDDAVAVTEVASGSTSTGSKNEVDAEKYYQNKTTSEIAFLKRKEELVSFKVLCFRQSSHHAAFAPPRYHTMPS